MKDDKINPLDKAIMTIVCEVIEELEKILEADVMFYYGPIVPDNLANYKGLIEELNNNDGSSQKKKLAILINTDGGVVEIAEKYAKINRHFYDEVYFIVPDKAMSAGTIFCMSGDKIYMDYSSSLGPIDPQVFNGERYVPALGYLDKVSECIQKSEQNELSTAEIMLLQKLDFGFLRLCEQAENLSRSLIKDWLTKYKFKTWIKHSNGDNIVTREEKEQKAEEIARALGDHKKWKSHGRCLDIEVLNNIGLRIDDYSDESDLRRAIINCNTVILSLVQKNNFSIYMCTRMTI